MSDSNKLQFSIDENDIRINKLIDEELAKTIDEIITDNNEIDRYDIYRTLDSEGHIDNVIRAIRMRLKFKIYEYVFYATGEF